jgi:DNA-binding transcriptional regulator YiaG
MPTPVKIETILKRTDDESLPPIVRPDSAPISDNPIRAFRDELRLTAGQFALAAGVTIHSIRIWETNRSVLRYEAAQKLVDLAERNFYPLTLDDLYGVKPTRKRLRRRSA